MRVAVNRIFFRQRERFMRPPEPKHVLTRSLLDSVPFDVRNLSQIYVTGNSSMVDSKHPTIKLVLRRLKQQSKPGSRHLLDREKVALSIEGGGMRGCVSAGAAAALDFLGLNDAVDCVYGSSAGAMVGAYFVSRQVNGVQIYHDLLPSAGNRFIDKSRLLNAAGVPTNALSPRKLRMFLANNTIHRLLKIEPAARRVPVAAVVSRSSVINLHFLLDKIMAEMQSLDWSTFAANERLQPLHIVTTNVDDMTARVLTRSKGNFHDLFSLLNCIRASMLVPGVTEPLMTLASAGNVPPKTSSTLPLDNNKKRANEALSAAVTVAATADLQEETEKEHIAMKSWSLLQQWVMEQLEKRNPPAVILSSSSQPLTRKTIKLKSLSNNETSSSSNNSRNNRFAPFVEFQQRSGQVINHIKMVGRRNKEQKSTTASKQQLQPPISNQNDLPHRPIYATSVKREYEHLCDAFLAEPIPYRSAITDGATHVIVLRTRPDPSKVLGKGPGIYEQLIARRYFQLYQAHNAIDWLMNLQHARIYAEDSKLFVSHSLFYYFCFKFPSYFCLLVLTLNEAAHGPEHGINFFNHSVHILPIAIIDPTAKEVGQLETKREKILYGMRDGARRVLEIFLPEILTLEQQGIPSKLPSKLRDIFLEQKGMNVTIESVLDMIFPLSILEREISIEEMLESISLSKGNLI